MAACSSTWILYIDIAALYFHSVDHSLSQCGYLCNYIGFLTVRLDDCLLSGRLVVTTSWSARFAPPTLVAYSMTKHAAKALCDGLRAELGPFGIQVCSIEPNMYRSVFHWRVRLL